MFHPLWPDVNGGVSPPPKDRAPNRCPDCHHGFVIHAKHGGCNHKDCLCGWTRDATSGALRVKLTGLPAGETGLRKRYRGPSVGDGRRRRILRDPCYFCGEKAETLDHFYPRAKGGKSDDSNLVPACSLCNGLKSDRTYEELIVFCHQFRVSTNRKTSMRSVIRFQRYKIQAEKILARHEKRETSPRQ